MSVFIVTVINNFDEEKHSTTKVNLAISGVSQQFLCSKGRKRLLIYIFNYDWAWVVRLNNSTSYTEKT
jgi:hypothetical protein